MGLGSRLQRPERTFTPPPPTAAIVLPEQAVEPTLPSTGLSLKDLLLKYATQVEESRLTEDYIHASDLYGLCSRKAVLVKEPDVDLAPRVIAPALRITFDIGRAVESLLRLKYLGPMGVLYGDWRCVVCQALATGKMPKQCAGCGRKRFDYVERTVRNEEYKVVGNLDGMELHPAYGLGVLELKTIDGQLFKLLKQPQAEHIFRTHVYMWLSGLKWARILYVSKAMEKVSPLKEYFLSYDPKVVAPVIAKLKERADGGKKCCESSTDPRAIKCPVRGGCWTRAAGSGGD